MTCPDSTSVVQVLLPRPFDAAFDYAVPNHMAITEGMAVEVPFGRTHCWGVVWGRQPSQLPPDKLKPIIRRCAWMSEPLIDEAMRNIIDWTAHYTLSPRGMVLKMALSSPNALDDLKEEKTYRWQDINDLSMTTVRQRVRDALIGKSLSAAALASTAQVSNSVIQGLSHAGALIPEMKALLPEDGFVTFRDVQSSAIHPTLSSRQQQAAEQLTEAVIKRQPGVWLLDGETGSGKTEVYFAAINEALRKGQQTLVLLPEIALTAQLVDRASRYFGIAPVVWHSHMSPASRRDHWRAVAMGRAPLVVGARSALFLPYRDLGVIIVDEEHEPSYKQEDGVAYHARDIAVLRGHKEQIPVILASATPSLETICNAEARRYHHLRLPERHGNARLPDVALIDMTAQKLPASRFLSNLLVDELKQTLARGEQAMLFLNRRGYAPLTLCRACGYRFACSHCSSWMVRHGAHQLQCHHCGHRQAMPDHCPECGEEDQLVSCGPGVERIAEEVTHEIPQARLCLMTSDELTNQQAVEEVLQRIHAKDIDVIIGTQMIAKGHHFPELTLVGVVDADLGLEGGDLRAGESTFQLLHQVAGRAGRADKPGLVYIQTTQPDHPVLQAMCNWDRERFYDMEKTARRAAGMPPFARLAAIILSGHKEAEVIRTARLLASHASLLSPLRLLGPSPAPLYRLRGKYRYRLLISGSRGDRLQPIIRRWLDVVSLPSSVALRVDVDPIRFL